MAAAGVGVSAGLVAEALGVRAFSRLVHSDVQALAGRASRGKAVVVTEDMLGGLPEPVQRYLRYTGIVGKPAAGTVYLRQQGRVRLAGQRWIPLQAQEWFSVRPPGFVWDATMRVAGIPVGRARDMYQGGQGRMLVKAASLVTVADVEGEEMDQGSMMRYLSEVMWFPSALLEDNISFQAIDAASARVTLTDHGKAATATLLFDAAGRLTNFVARRYAIAGKSRDFQTWSVPVADYGEFEGLRLPARVKAVWKLAEGDREDIDVTLSDLHYDA
ncbi:MAG TPA: DUF6544 family protein [Streptosporangiaceae bacterium]|nr:DUF6544 family protein [Streptosporangiaceae bacterium]